MQSRRGIVAEGLHGESLIDGVLFESIRIEHLIETEEHHAGAQMKPIVPFEINAGTSSIRNINIRNVSWNGVGDAESFIKATSANDNVMNVELEHLLFNGNVAGSLSDINMHVDKYVTNKDKKINL